MAAKVRAEMKARKAGHLRHIVERERLAEMAFDVPERPADRLHVCTFRSDEQMMASMRGKRRLIGVAVTRLRRLSFASPG